MAQAHPPDSVGPSPDEAASSFELEIERLAAGGDGVGHVAGLAVFVPLTAPGDRVLVRVVRRHARFARAELLEVRRPGPGRRAPPCPYAARCGGCSWLHLDDATQRDARVAILHDALTRVGRLRDLPAIEWLPSPRALGYRQRARVARDGGRTGFRARRSAEVIDIERCAVLTPDTQAALAALRREPHRGSDEVELRGFGSQLGDLHVSPGAFAQANAPLLDAWCALVAEAVGEGDTLLELYAGVGFYTTRLEARFREVVCVERGPSSADLLRNTRARVLATSVERAARLPFADIRPDVALLNPPRAGCAKAVVESLVDAGPRRIVYVSCNPATLARDLSLLSLRYAIRRLVCIDAMPQTHHVEALAQLELREQHTRLSR